MYFCVSNSHASPLTGQNIILRPGPHNYDSIPGYKTYSIGTIVAALFYDKQLNGVLELCHQYMRKDDWLVLIIGEEQWRCNIPLFARQQKMNPFEVAEQWFVSFFAAIKKLNKYYKTCMMTSHPSTSLPEDLHPDHPIIGHYSIRNAIGLYWDKLGHQYCEAYNIAYASIYEDLLNSDLSAKSEYFKDFCHLNLNATPLMKKRIEEATSK